MKVRITVGQTQVVVSGLDLSRKEIRRLLMDVASIAAATAEDAPEAPNPVGFSAHVERAGNMSPEAYFTDDEE